MAIAIPALIDTQLGYIKEKLVPAYHSDTHTYSSSRPPFAEANRVADILKLLTGLIDTGTLVATGGSTISVVDVGAFTGVNSLIGAKITFQGNATPALAGVSAYVISNTVDTCFFAPGALPAAPVAGDNYAVEFTTIDREIEALNGGKNLGDTQSNPYGYGPTMISALTTLILVLGGTVPSWLQATPFTMGSPHAGGSAGGQGGAMLLATALQLTRDTLAAYTKPA